MDRRTDGQTDGRTDGRPDGRTDGWRQTGGRGGGDNSQRPACVRFDRAAGRALFPCSSGRGVARWMTGGPWRSSLPQSQSSPPQLCDGCAHGGEAGPSSAEVFD